MFEDSEEDEDMGDVVLTKDGYAKDGFIVDDDDDEFEDDDDDEFEDDESSEDAKPKHKIKKNAKVNKKSTKYTKKIVSEPEEDDNNIESVFLNCQTELEEEEYV